MKNQKKAIVLGLTASMLMPVCFNGGTAEAAAADRDVAAMQAEINDLTARLTDLENSLAAAKEKQEAAKSEKKAKKEAVLLARELMKKQLPLTTICYDSGFKQYSAFYRAWKKQYGQSPKKGIPHMAKAHLLE